MDKKLEKKGLYGTTNIQNPNDKITSEKELFDSGPKSQKNQKASNSLSNNSSIEIKPNASLNASADGEYEGEDQNDEEEEEDEEDEGFDLESNLNKNKKEERIDPPAPKVYTTGERILNKFSGLFSMLILFSLVTMIYGTYIFWHVSPQLATSNVGPNMKFWKSELWEDPLYTKGMVSFLFVNIMLGFFLTALYKSAFISPGNIPEDLKTSELDANQVERVNAIANAYSFSSRISEEGSLSDQEKIGNNDIWIVASKDAVRDPSHFSFTTEEVNIQGKQGENVVKRPIIKDKKAGEDAESQNAKLPKILNDVNVSKKFKEAFLSIIRESVEHKNKEGSLGKPRYCQTCKGYKPDRCHHCSLCNKCILKMDHHCPFVNNCIGFYNYKYFMLMLLYSSIMLIYIIVTMLEAVHFVVNEMQVSFMGTAYVIMIYTIVILLGIIVTCFMFFHFWMIIKGLTTIEFREKLSRRYRTSPYDVNAYDNFKSVFGKNPLAWFLPFGVNNDGFGLKYKVRKDI